MQDLRQGALFEGEDDSPAKEIFNKFFKVDGWVEKFNTAKEYLEFIFSSNDRLVYKYIVAADCYAPGILVDKLGIWRIPKAQSDQRKIEAPKLVVARFDPKEKYIGVQVLDADHKTYRSFKMTKKEWLEFRESLSSREVMPHVPY